MVILQGEVYLVDLGNSVSTAMADVHPCVILQNNWINRSRITTVIVCAITSNLKRANDPGNVRLEIGEASLLMTSVANVSQVFTIDKSRLGNKLGILSQERVRKILAGLRKITDPS